MGDEHFRKLERMYSNSPINAFFLPRLTVGEGRAELVIPLSPRLFHSGGAVHGAVYFKAMDDAAFFAVNSLVEGFFVLTASFQVYLLHPVKEGEIRATGRVLHATKRQYLAEAELLDSKANLIGRGNGAFVPSTLRLGPEIGYL